MTAGATATARECSGGATAAPARTTDTEADGATFSDPVETTVTSPNAGTIAISEFEVSNTAPFGFRLLGQQVRISAPPATAANPLILVFELYGPFLPVGTDINTLAIIRDATTVVPDCTGAPGIAAPDPCIASRVVQIDGDIVVTVLSSGASDWNLALPAPCPSAPDTGCTTGFGKALLAVKENAPGREKVLAKLANGPALAQADFGNPLGSGGTAYHLCIYDDGGQIAGGLHVDRAGDSCGSADCWAPLGAPPPDGKGFKYKDPSTSADGVFLVLLKAGEPGKSKAIVKARAPSPPLPAGIAAALAGSSSVTVQLHRSDAPSCLSATLTDVKKNEADFFKAK